MDDREPASDRSDGEFPALIRAGLARVLASDAFRAAPQLSAFLGFIVERAVQGRGPELKGYTIAVEALGRSSDFDPQSDPIVRVEAGRLRRALAQYYAGEGAADPVRISMPVGAYVPAFDLLRRQEADHALAGQSERPAPVAVAATVDDAGRPSPPPATTLERRVARRWPLLAILCLGVALASLVAWYAGLPGGGAGPEASSPPPAPVASVAASAPESAPRDRPSELTVLTVSLVDMSNDPRLSALSERFASFLVDALARFDDLITVKAPPAGEVPPTGADYALEMMVRTVDGTTESFGRLRSVRDGRIVWSSSSLRAWNVNDGDLPDLARRLASRLAEPFGIIHADIRQNAGSESMRCIYQAVDVRRTMKQKEHLAARQCTQRLIDRDPAFYPGWIQFAFLSLAEYTSGLNPQPGWPLERALSAALTAVRLAPSSARAQQALMETLFARGATEEALKAGREALSRNPYDSDIIASLGARYILLNRPAEGLPLVERAIELNPGRPPAYDFFALLGAHLLGAQQLSRGHGEFLAADVNFYALLGRALQAAQKGNDSDRTEALAALRRNFEFFDAEPRLSLMRRGFSPEVIERILSDLAIVHP